MSGNIEGSDCTLRSRYSLILVEILRSSLENRLRLTTSIEHNVGELRDSDAYDVFINPDTRQLTRVTLDGMDKALSYIDKRDAQPRRDLMIEIGILNPGVDFDGTLGDAITIEKYIE